MTSLVSGSVSLLEFGDLGVCVKADENIPPGVLLADAIPPPGENNEYDVGDNHGSTVMKIFWQRLKIVRLQ